MAEQAEHNYNFRVEIDGLEDTYFTEVTGLGSSIEVVEYRDGADVSLASRSLPGRPSFDRIILRRGLAATFELWDWHQATLNGDLQHRSGAIIALARDGEPVVAWRFRNAWVARYRGPTFVATGNGVAIETVELVHEGLQRESV